MPSVFFYISGHGFGHASREIEVINAVAGTGSGQQPACSNTPGLKLGPADDHQIVIRSSAARWLFDRNVRRPFTLIDGACDTGVVQIDSLRLDEHETIRRAADFHRHLPEHIEREAALLRRHGARLVVADAPPLACAAAHAAGVPSVVLSNFTWDWIYEGYAEALAAAPDLIPIIQDAYRRADEAWRLPLHGGFATFDHRPFSSRERHSPPRRTGPRQRHEGREGHEGHEGEHEEEQEGVTDVPFVARHATHDRLEVRRRLDLPGDMPVALASFGGYGLRDFDPRRLDCLGRWSVVISGHRPSASLPAGVRHVDEGTVYDANLRYEDLVHAVDVVVTKPGFGIVAECLANDTAMLYTSRGRFREYDVMVAEMPRFLRCQFIDMESLLAGQWDEALDRLLHLPPPPDHPRTDGAEVVAGMIRDRLASP